jgi:hypothetical protein
MHRTSFPLALSTLALTAVADPTTIDSRQTWPGEGVYANLEAWPTINCSDSIPQNFTVKGLGCQTFSSYGQDNVVSVWAPSAGDTCQSKCY